MYFSTTYQTNDVINTCVYISKAFVQFDSFYRTAVRYIGTLSVCLPNLCCGYLLIKTLVVLINVTKAFGMKDFVGMYTNKAMSIYIH